MHKLLHPNIYPSGTVCLSALAEKWNPTITIKQILLELQNLLANPNLEEPAKVEAFVMYCTNRAKYDRIIKEMVKRTFTNVDGNKDGTTEPTVI